MSHALLLSLPPFTSPCSGQGARLCRRTLREEQQMHEEFISHSHRDKQTQIFQLTGRKKISFSQFKCCTLLAHA